MRFLLIYTSLVMYTVIYLHASVCLLKLNILRLFEIALQLHDQHLIQEIQLYVET